MGNTSEWIGKDLGTLIVTYDETRAILYALAVGADASDLALVFEESPAGRRTYSARQAPSTSRRPSTAPSASAG